MQPTASMKMCMTSTPFYIPVRYLVTPGCPVRHNALKERKAGYPGLLGLRCRRNEVMPGLARDTGSKEPRLHRRDPGSAFEFGPFAANAARRQASQTEVDRPNRGGRLNCSVPNGNDPGSTAKAGAAALTKPRPRFVRQSHTTRTVDPVVLRAARSAWALAASFSG
jgi:hypothetical protein